MKLDMVAWLKKHWLRTALWLLLILPVLSFLLASASIMLYMFWPRSFDEINTAQFTAPQTEDDVRHLTILAHGMRDNPRTWIDPLKEVYAAKDYEGSVLGVDWSPYAQSSLTCAVNGRRIGKLIGREIGEQLAAKQSIDSAHLIAHSCGAFVIYGACQAIKQSNESIVVQTTYLDPVSIYGIWWDYGIKHFGSCADYSEAYIDTEDSIHGSNQLIPNTHTYDVTRKRKQAGSPVPPHVWPVAYYEQLVRDNSAPKFWEDDTLKSRKPAGELEKVQ